ncbi:protein PYRICULARIA ORYZAE RESISTANCE 21-like [Corylus avellana]|uniref:protein PYRICULARIA ORYZAE RESISTANCE 21-like n=1 Tax=Corylus avellana TaxID=13451 RepID=UPI00286CD687|nr:protein PYRICULARIA ORYZAE RESISTANCE 21-like [Corylus avellana]
MGEKGITIMVLKVDLQCRRCYKKVKKVLCKFPQIHDQIYDEKKNTVTIKVVCCCPEKIMQKIRCKGGNSILCIEILPPPKPPQQKKEDPKPPPPPKEDPKPPPPPKEDPKPPPPKVDPKPPQPEPPCKVPVVVQVCPPDYVYPSARVCCRECSEGRPGGPCFEGHGQPPRQCCRECSEGRPGGPCFEGHGQPPRPCYVVYGRPVYDSYGGGWNRGCYVSRCDYFCEESPSGCTVM